MKSTETEIEPLGGKSLANNDNYSVASEPSIVTIDFEEIYNSEASDTGANITPKKGNMQLENPSLIEISVSPSTTICVKEIQNKIFTGDEKGKLIVFF